MVSSSFHRWVEEVERFLDRSALSSLDEVNVSFKEIARSIRYWHLWIGAPVVPWGPVKNKPLLKRGYARLRKVPFPASLYDVERYIDWLRRNIGDSFNVAAVLRHVNSRLFTAIDVDAHNPIVTRLDIPVTRNKGGRPKKTTPRTELIDECTRHGIYIEETASGGLHIVVRGYVDIAGLGSERETGIGIYGSFRGNVLFIYPTHFSGAKPYRIYPEGIAPHVEVEGSEVRDAIPKATPKYIRHILEWYLVDVLGHSVEIRIGSGANGGGNNKVSETKIETEFVPVTEIDRLSNEELLLLLYLVADRVGCKCMAEAIEHWFEHGVFPIKRLAYPGTSRYLHFHFEVQLLGALYLLGVSEERAKKFLEVIRYPDGIVESDPKDTSLKNVYDYGNVNIACSYLCPVGYALYKRHVCGRHGTFIINILRMRHSLLSSIRELIRDAKRLYEAMKNEARGEEEAG